MSNFQFYFLACMIASLIMTKAKIVAPDSTFAIRFAALGLVVAWNVGMAFGIAWLVEHVH